ncbi:uncharacterized protein LOC113754129 isoform X2 [Coffea eugenioides]|uniref:uncharacterized protein LOC113754129 isoform X2 n=1 Tax=Coffea eugenioides TaxID=49369 RepID=UPI000F60BA26|nr:uncharacterized protein LOC113754129 isoform X2 [Coffea eugenioides]
MGNSEKPFPLRLIPIRNSNTQSLFYLLLFLLVLGHSIQSVDSGASDGSSRRKGVEWQILTKLNYSSEIRRHPNLLLMITLPWCGESRSLEKQLANAVTTQQERFGSLKLMLLYRNTERMLANALGASESGDAVTIIYFHHSLSYKYRGTLRVQNILSSVHHVMSLLPEHLPLRLLRTSHELRNFLDSTDITLLLLDFCGWTPGLLARGLSEETNGTLVQEEKQPKVDGIQGPKMSCSADKGLNQFPWLTELTLGNDGNFSEADKITHTDGFSCTVDELQLLKSFLRKLMKFARDFFLPPERLGFGLVSEKSLLSELDIEASAAPWLMKLYSAGCPTCSKVLTEGDDLKAILQTQKSVVTELTDDMYDVPTLPASRASILLFIDRSSDSLSIRKDSKEALDAFRQLAMHHNISKHMPGGSTIKLTKSSDETARGHDAGFQLLSEDFEIKDAEPLPVQPEFQPNLEFSQKDDIEDTLGLDRDTKLQNHVSFKPVTDEESRMTDATSSYLGHQNDPIGKNEESSAEYTRIHTTRVGDGQERMPEEERLAGVHEQTRHKGFSGSFFFCDGHSRLLGALTASSLKIPSVVIIDPIMQKHFILPETATLSYSSLSDFLDGFLNQSLSPYRQSETVLQSPREAPVPPFVNLDFHETESIPRVTAHTFSELVLGNQSDSVNDGNPWDKDALVLLSNSWCGFCQRMEMVVREVFRAIQGYDRSSSKNSLLTKDNIRSSTKVPLIYLMDCTLNDCSWILKSVVQREIYPSLLLFPAGRKDVISYEGDVAVYDVIRFLSDHGTLVNEKDISWGEIKEGGGFSITAPLSQSTYYEVFLEDQKREVAATQFRVQSWSSSHESTPLVVPGCILTATDKLLNVQPFDESKILIVKVNQATGFEGLIVNKHINWESLEELEEGLQKLKGAPLSYGGPVMKQGMPLVALAQKFVDDKHPEVLPDVYFLDQWATLRLMDELKLGNKSVRGHWFFLGFSSWGWEQLFHEIAEGAWHVSKGNTEHLDWPEIF